MQAHEEAGGAIIARGNEYIAEDEGAGCQESGVGAGGCHCRALDIDCRSKSHKSLLGQKENVRRRNAMLNQRVDREIEVLVTAYHASRFNEYLEIIP